MREGRRKEGRKEGKEGRREAGKNRKDEFMERKKCGKEKWREKMGKER